MAGERYRLAEISLIRLEIVTEHRMGVGLPDPIRSAADVLPMLEDLQARDRETFVCIHLNVRNQVNAMEVIAVGCLGQTLIHPREVFKAAVLRNSAGIILAHNHPSGNPDPSTDDLAMTKRIVAAGELLGIEVLDHLIVSASGRYMSMKEKGMI